MRDNLKTNNAKSIRINMKNKENEHQMLDVMLDIETFGIDNNAVIVSISAVKFNITTGEMGETFEIGLNIQEQIDKGAIIDGSTVMWWLEQSKEAQNELTNLKAVDIETALKAFNDFVLDPVGLWGNGATFDNVLVRNLYKRHGINFVVPFWVDRCVRTFVSILGIDKGATEFIGTAHNGLDDCRHQIRYMTQGK